MRPSSFTELPIFASENTVTPYAPTFSTGQKRYLDTAGKAKIVNWAELGMAAFNLGHSNNVSNSEEVLTKMWDFSPGYGVRWINTTLDSEILTDDINITGKSMKFDFSKKPGDPGIMTDDGKVVLKSSFGLNNPSDLVVNQNGEFAISNTGLNQVIRLNLTTPSGSSSTFNGQILNDKKIGDGRDLDIGDGLDASIASIYRPRGLVYDSAGNLFISTESGLIKKVDVNTNIITTIAGASLETGGIFALEAPADKVYLNKPYGMALDENNGFLYVADTGNKRIVRIDFLKKSAQVVAGNGTCEIEQDDRFKEHVNVSFKSTFALEAGLCEPRHLHLDDKNNLLIVDYVQSNKLIKDRLIRVNFKSEGAKLAFNPSSPIDLSKIVRNEDGTFVRSLRDGTQFFFDKNGNQTLVKDRIGRSTSFEYSNEKLIKITDPSGTSLHYEYFGDLLSTITDPVGRVTSFNYLGNLLTSVLYPDGTSKEFEYDENGRMIGQFNERGLKTSFTYKEFTCTNFRQ